MEGYGKSRNITGKKCEKYRMWGSRAVQCVIKINNTSRSKYSLVDAWQNSRSTDSESSMKNRTVKHVKSHTDYESAAR